MSLNKRAIERVPPELWLMIFRKLLPENEFLLQPNGMYERQVIAPTSGDCLARNNKWRESRRVLFNLIQSSNLFHQSAIEVLYTAILVDRQTTAVALCVTLLDKPSLGSHVRHLRVSSSPPDTPSFIHLLPQLSSITIDLRASIFLPATFAEGWILRIAASIKASSARTLRELTMMQEHVFTEPCEEIGSALLEILSSTPYLERLTISGFSFAAMEARFPCLDYLSFLEVWEDERTPDTPIWPEALLPYPSLTHVFMDTAQWGVQRNRYHALLATQSTTIHTLTLGYRSFLGSIREDRLTPLLSLLPRVNLLQTHVSWANYQKMKITQFEHPDLPSRITHFAILVSDAPSSLACLTKGRTYMSTAIEDVQRLVAYLRASSAVRVLRFTGPSHSELLRAMAVDIANGRELRTSLGNLSVEDHEGQPLPVILLEAECTKIVHNEPF